MSTEDRDRIDALTRGLIGDGAASRHVRLELARSALSAHRERAWALDDATDTAFEPFAAQLLVDHRGDVRAVLEDPAFVDELAQHIAGGDRQLQLRLAQAVPTGPVADEYRRLVEATTGRKDWRRWGGSANRLDAPAPGTWPDQPRELSPQSRR
ncbi:hypothetical protein Cch01nite_18650 [Cellulomonas chitinilytica]|uniref:Uncharacterized protein n=1 Tax=Cellulomonas chitinilytica TaxID=398759 RepID=A0A919U186_9CELL|nr:hypothetical protein [Cellulomonas chitinilytica]GIG21141.1 hypothetical protein Cch01nite_18650 [Cellulomonas chitinilytica]